MPDEGLAFYCLVDALNRFFVFYNISRSTSTIERVTSVYGALWALRTKLVSRTIETKASSQRERIEVSLNVEQAEYTRDALATGLSSRLFDYLVAHINTAMQMNSNQLLK